MSLVESFLLALRCVVMAQTLTSSTNQSTVSGEIWTNESAGLWLGLVGQWDGRYLPEYSILQRTSSEFPARDMPRANFSIFPIFIERNEINKSFWNFSSGPFIAMQESTTGPQTKLVSTNEKCTSGHPTPPPPPVIIFTQLHLLFPSEESETETRLHLVTKRWNLSVCRPAQFGLESDDESLWDTIGLLRVSLRTSKGRL